MTEIKDRIPTLPGRVKITRANGAEEYVTIERADEPLEVGTPINKALLDEIIADKKYVVGTYTGDDADTKTIELGFTPSAVLVTEVKGNTGRDSSNYINGGLALLNYPVFSSPTIADAWAIKIVTNGFMVRYSTGYKISTNSDGSVLNPYRYIAWE